MHYVLGAGWPGPSACRPAPTRHIIASSALEGFFGHMKDEFYRGAEFESFEDLKLALDEYVTYWNTRRYQVALKGMSPVQYRGHPIRAA